MLHSTYFCLFRWFYFFILCIFFYGLALSLLECWTLFCCKSELFFYKRQGNEPVLQPIQLRDGVCFHFLVMYSVQNVPFWEGAELLMCKITSLLSIAFCIIKFKIMHVYFFPDIFCSMLFEVRWNGKNLVVVHVLCMSLYEDVLGNISWTRDDTKGRYLKLMLCSQYSVLLWYSKGVTKANFRNGVNGKAI